MRPLCLIIIAFAAGCSQFASSDELSPFRSLRRGMTIEQGRNAVGQPTLETGSGLAIDVYRLKDGSEVWLGYAGQEGLINVTHGQDQLLPGDGG